MWVADDIAESLDPTALDRFVDLLRDMTNERGTILTISHVDMSGHIPNVLTVTKTSGARPLIRHCTHAVASNVATCRTTTLDQIAGRSGMRSFTW